MSESALAVSFCSTLESMRVGRRVYLPIKSIENIEVQVEINRHNEDKYTLKIIPLDFSIKRDGDIRTSDGGRCGIQSGCIESDDTLFYKIYYRNEAADNLRVISNDILTSLKKMKIDKVNGEFSVDERNTENKMDELYKAFVAEFIHHEPIVLLLNECCVCYTPTKTKTNCDHAVCLECISNLPTAPHMEIGDSCITQRMRCPMCRQHITNLL
jgi:hypothetical protein